MLDDVDPKQSAKTSMAVYSIGNENLFVIVLVTSQWPWPAHTQNVHLGLKALKEKAHIKSCGNCSTGLPAG